MEHGEQLGCELAVVKKFGREGAGTEKKLQQRNKTGDAQRATNKTERAGGAGLIVMAGSGVC